MKNINIGLAGFGTIGKGVVDILIKHQELLAKRRHIHFHLKAIADLDIKTDRGVATKDAQLFTDAFELIKDPDIHIIVELMGGKTFAYDFVKAALEAKKHVITANKALLAEKGKELFEIACENHLFLAFEGSVAGGIPILKTIRESLVGNRISRVLGIVNGTSNYILTKMSEEEMDFETALILAQEKGFAEQDPTLDINGEDAAHKIVLLSELAFNTYIPYEKVYVEGIEDIELVDIEYARSLGYATKLIAATSRYVDGSVSICVHPALIPLGSPLASVKNEYNGILVESDYLGTSFYYGKGAGTNPTASAVVQDIVDVSEKVLFGQSPYPVHPVFFEEQNIRSINDNVYKYYIRLNVPNEVGVMASISRKLADNQININMVMQESQLEEYVHVIFLVEYTTEKQLQNALKEITNLPFIKAKEKVMRIL